MPNVAAYLAGWGASSRKVISTSTVRAGWPWRRVGLGGGMYGSSLGVVTLRWLKLVIGDVLLRKN